MENSRCGGPPASKNLSIFPEMKCLRVLILCMRPQFSALPPDQTQLPRSSMASLVPLSAPSMANPRPPATAGPASQRPALVRLPSPGRRSSSRVVAVSAVGEVSADGNTYLIAGAVAVALLGTAFPILFSRRDICPECDGAGFIRQSGVTLRANAARKDQSQIVCARCNGLGKLGQIDK